MDFVPFARGKLWKNKADFFRPFRTPTTSAGENIVPLYDPAIHRTEVEDLDLKDLNTALAVLVEVFPEVQPEVFREMLVSVSDESRLQVVTEHLLTRKTKWVRGRYRTPAETPGPAVLVKKQKARRETPGNDVVPSATASLITDEQVFRSDGYKKAVKQVFYQEFKGLSHSSIRAVLAEQNFSYTLTRPVLQQLSTRSWRFSFSSIWPRKPPAAAAGEHPFILWQSGYAGGQEVPAIKRTGNAVLDQELYDLFVVPTVENQRRALLAGDFSLATKLNRTEAEKRDALFDCECCFNSVVFEQLATCDNDCHQLCFDCVRRTVSEALFGQGWARAADLERTTVRCFAPTSEGCNGVISSNVLRRALSSGAENEELWNEFQDRAAAEAISKSHLPLQRCPFCAYVEVNDVPNPQRRDAMGIANHIATRTSASSKLLLLIIAIFMTMSTIPILVLGSYAWLAFKTYPPAIAAFQASWSRVYRMRRGLKFHCRHPSCSKVSCTRCLAPWHDIHTCFETEKTSLRTTIEASATAAVKRTCPKCLLSFVKSTGCNKLVCNCGYTMCYICRQEIGSKEGYGHFCQHFRPMGGRCGECEKCDLYGDEDEEAAIRRAAEEAERAWREREGGMSVEGEGMRDVRVARAMVEVVVGRAEKLREWEVGLDFFLDAVMA